MRCDTAGVDHIAMIDPRGHRARHNVTTVGKRAVTFRIIRSGLELECTLRPAFFAEIVDCAPEPYCRVIRSIDSSLKFDGARRAFRQNETGVDCLRQFHRVREDSVGVTRMAAGSQPISNQQRCVKTIGPCGHGSNRGKLAVVRLVRSEQRDCRAFTCRRRGQTMQRRKILLVFRRHTFVDELVAGQLQQTANAEREAIFMIELTDQLVRDVVIAGG